MKMLQKMLLQISRCVTNEGLSHLISRTNVGPHCNRWPELCDSCYHHVRLSLSLQLQFGFFRQQTSVSGTNRRIQLQHSSSSASTLFPLRLRPYPPRACGAPLLLPFLLYQSSSPWRSHRAPAPLQIAPGVLHPAPPPVAPPTPLLLPGSSPAGPGQGPAHELWYPWGRQHPASSSTASSSAAPRSAELLPLSVRPAPGAGLPLSRSHGLTPQPPRPGLQEAQPSQSPAHQRRSQCPAGGHQKRWVPSCSSQAGEMHQIYEITLEASIKSINWLTDLLECQKSQMAQRLKFECRLIFLTSCTIVKCNKCHMRLRELFQPNENNL